MKKLFLAVLAIAIYFTIGCAGTKGKFIVFYAGTDFGLNVEADLITEKAKLTMGLKRHEGAFIRTTDNSTPSLLGLFGVGAKVGLGGEGPIAEVKNIFAIGKAAEIAAGKIK